MWSKVWFVIYFVVAVTEGNPGKNKELHQNEVQSNVPHDVRTNINDANKDSIGMSSRDQRLMKSNTKVPAPLVDDDLLEFLVRIADNPTEWNKIRHVLSLLGQNEKNAQTTTVTVDSGVDVAVAVPSTSTPIPPSSTSPPVTSAMASSTAASVRHHDPRPSQPPVVPYAWPSGDWILEAVEKIRAATRARGIGAGGEDGGGSKDPFDYDDDDDDDDDDDNDADDEIEEIEEPSTYAATMPAVVTPRPPPRVAAGHMSRYQFRRIDGRPGDGRINGTYVAVVERDMPPQQPRLGVVFDQMKQKKSKSTK